jgi:benzoyl-CoA reductase/2-hydroxyglutaryl-CoA dehydratase subunit BcrC/BadD/HgdB
MPANSQKHDLVKYSYMIRNFSHFARLGFKVGPLRTRRLFRDFPWLSTGLKAHRLMDYCDGYSPFMGEIVHVLFHYMISVLETHANRPERLIWFEELLTPEIPLAMGLTPFMTEAIGLILPLIDKTSNQVYVDATENAGYPADMCSFIKTALGQVLMDELPKPRLILTTNSPCDSAMAGYIPIQERLGVPVFRMDHPFETNERSVEYYTRYLWKMIRFLEDETGVRLDFDRLREICEERNRASNYILEFRELMRARPCPAGGSVLTLSILGHEVVPGTKLATQFTKSFRDEAQRRVQKKIGAIKDEKIRMILWNPPFLIDIGLFNWMEKTFGAVVAMDMLAYRSYSFIDTSTPETMLRGLAYDMMLGPMARHTRGPAKNYYEDLIRLVEDYDADMILMAAHQGCKNSLSIMGIVRQVLRKHGIPFLPIQYDLVDPRITSPEEIRNQVTLFMETVMQV